MTNALRAETFHLHSSAGEEEEEERFSSARQQEGQHKWISCRHWRANNMGILNTPFRQWGDKGGEEEGWGVLFCPVLPSFPCLSSHLPDPAPFYLPSRVREDTRADRKSGKSSLNEGGEGSRCKWRHGRKTTRGRRVTKEEDRNGGKGRRCECTCGGQRCETRQVAVTLKMTVIKVTVRRWIWWFWLANQSSVKRTTTQIQQSPDTSWLMPVPDGKKKKGPLTVLLLNLVKWHEMLPSPALTIWILLLPKILYSVSVSAIFHINPLPVVTMNHRHI